MRSVNSKPKLPEPDEVELRPIFPASRKAPIRSSAITDREHCPRKFLYRYRWGLKPKGYNSALETGSTFHLVLQAMFSGHDKDRALNAAAPRLNTLTNECYANADPAGFLPDGTTVQATIQKITDDYHKARAMAAAFMEYQPFDRDKWEILETPDGTPCVELLLEAKVEGIAAPLIAPCDLALHKLGTNEVWIVDHKTTSLKALARARAARLSPQMQLYRLVLQCHLDSWVEGAGRVLGPGDSRYRVVGSIHNIVKKPGIVYKPKGKDKEGFQHYLDRVAEWYKDEHAKDKDNSPILQVATRFEKEVLPRELFLRLARQAEYSHKSPDLDTFHRAGDMACLDYSRECPYAPLCYAPCSQWPIIMDQRYEIKFREDEEEESNA